MKNNEIIEIVKATLKLNKIEYSSIVIKEDRNFIYFKDYKDDEIVCVYPLQNQRLFVRYVNDYEIERIINPDDLHSTLADMIERLK